jgi:adenylate kinase
MPIETSPSVSADLEVDTEKLRREIAHNPLGRVVAYGHLLPYILSSKDVDLMVVLRCEPEALRARLVKRGYPVEKIMDNVEAELIGLISEDARLAFGARKIMEFDTTALSPASSARKVSRLLQKHGPPGDRIDWTLRYGSARKLRSLLSPAKAWQG